MAELRPSGSRGYLRSEPILRSSASEPSSTGTRWEEEVGFSGIRIGGKPGTGGIFSIFRQSKVRLHPPDIIGRPPPDSARQHGVPCSEMGCRRLHGISCPGG